jgi:RNA polymerase sigma-70 factor (ECF subfamily)
MRASAAAQAIVLPVAPLRRRAAAADDRALVADARAGSRDALETLFRRHWPRLHRAAYLVCHDAGAAEDIAQEAFLSAVRALDRFDRSRPFAPWITRIAVNRAIDWTRGRAARPEALDAEPRAVAPAQGSDIDADAVSLLATLPPEQRAVVVLRHVVGCTPREIADILDLPVGTVNSRMRRGLDTLGRALEEPR